MVLIEQSRPAGLYATVEERKETRHFASFIHWMEDGKLPVHGQCGNG